MVSSNTIPEDLNLKFKSKFNPAFTDHGCLHCAILKALYGFKRKKTTRQDWNWNFLDLKNV